MFGYHGRYLRIDPRPGRSALVPIPESPSARFLGGVGLGTWIVARETPAGSTRSGRTRRWSSPSARWSGRR